MNKRKSCAVLLTVIVCASMNGCVREKTDQQTKTATVPETTVQQTIEETKKADFGLTEEIVIETQTTGANNSAVPTTAQSQNTGSQNNAGTLPEEKPQSGGVAPTEGTHPTDNTNPTQNTTPTETTESPREMSPGDIQFTESTQPVVNPNPAPSGGAGADVITEEIEF